MNHDKPPLTVHFDKCGNMFQFRQFDLGVLQTVIDDDGTHRVTMIAGTFLPGLWWKGSPVLDPDRTFEPIQDPQFYKDRGCNPPVELADTPFAADLTRHCFTNGEEPSDD
ncbi:MAG: hypothetical protein AAF943_17210 [Pseudomonadota bacterium]